MRGFLFAAKNAMALLNVNYRSPWYTTWYTRHPPFPSLLRAGLTSAPAVMLTRWLAFPASRARCDGQGCGLLGNTGATTLLRQHPPAIAPSPSRMRPPSLGVKGRGYVASLGVGFAHPASAPRISSGIFSWFFCGPAASSGMTHAGAILSKTWTSLTLGTFRGQAPNSAG